MHPNIRRCNISTDNRIADLKGCASITHTQIALLRRRCDVSFAHSQCQRHRAKALGVIGVSGNSQVRRQPTPRSELRFLASFKSLTRQVGWLRSSRDAFGKESLCRLNIGSMKHFNDGIVWQVVYCLGDFA